MASLPFDSEVGCTSPGERRSHLKHLLERDLRKDEVPVAYCSGIFSGPSGSPMFASKFARGTSGLLATSDQNGAMFLLECGPGEGQNDEIIGNGSSSTIITHKRTWNAHENTIFDISWQPGNKCIATGSGDATVAIWDTETGKISASFVGHRASVKSVDFMNSNRNIVLSGGRDGFIMLWDMRCKGSSAVSRPRTSTAKRKRNQLTKYGKNSPFSIIDIIGDDKNPSTVTAARFFPDDRLVVSAESNNGTVKYWDIRSDVPRDLMCLCRRDSGFGSNAVDISEDSSRLLVSSTNGAVYIYNCMNPGSGEILEFTQGRHVSYYVKTCLSPCGRFFVTGATEPFGLIYDTWYSRPPIILAGHSNDVNGVDWSKNRICTCSDDGTTRIWSVGNGLSGEVLEEAPSVAVGHDSESSRRIKVTWKGKPGLGVAKSNGSSTNGESKRRKRTIHYYFGGKAKMK